MKGLFWKEPLSILKGPVVFVFSGYYEVPFVGENCLLPSRRPQPTREL